VRPLDVGDPAPVDALVAVDGRRIALAPPARPVHVQLRRFAGCPVCNLHLRSFALRVNEIESAGIQVVAVFRSPADALLPYQAELPFPLVADPEGRLYQLAGVGSGVMAMAHPRAVRAALLGALTTRDLGRRPQDGLLGLVGDLLIGADGRVLALHRGIHADDQWDIDELLALRRAAPIHPTPEAPTWQPPLDPDRP
jgi:peroxiredoxin